MNLLLRALPYLAAALLAWVAWVRVDGWCNSACRDERARAETAEKAIAAAQKRATDLALLYSNTIASFDEMLRAKQKETDAKLALLEDRARRAGAGRTVLVSSDSVGVWHDAARSAGGSDPPAAAGEREERPAVPRSAEAYVSEDELNVFIARAAAAYKSVNDARLACIAIYEGTNVGE